MKLLRFLISTSFTAAAALAGNWAGDELRFRLTGERSGRFQYLKGPEPEGDVTLTINPALSNFLPALLVGILRKPHAPWAFIAGALITAVIGEQYEEEFNAQLKDLVRRS